LGAADPQPAASILLIARDGSVLVAERAKGSRFLGGFIAFPGGRVDEADSALAGALFGRSREEDVARAAALRELFEETGLLFDGTRAILASDELLARPASEAYRASSIALRPDALAFGGRWVTPSSSPMRFDTSFFVAFVEKSETPRPSADELAWARFVDPEEALDRWRRLEWLAAPPSKHALEILAAGIEDVPRRLMSIPEATGGESIEFEGLQGVRVVPLRSPTLPPATHTNAYVIGDERIIVVDPAAYDDNEREKVSERIEERLRGGAVLDAVVLTHHHFDHMGAAMWLKARHRCPIWAHPITRSLLEGKVEVDRTIDEGDQLDLGDAETGGRFLLDVLFTPGHAPGHIVLWDRRPGGRALIAGDMIAGVGTIIIDPPEGDMAVYVAQLERLARIAPGCIAMPAHGPPSVDGRAKLMEYVAHRLMREEKVMRALLARGTATPVDLLDLAYDDTNPMLYPLAARSCFAHLLKLEKDGRAVREGDRFTALGS
jgi:glyoxylase-like metal-dependent hydrolase (beta-lactamase superfamily II)/8-oxo-dGTP pyrophosphatase MutT (NUDIX family)